MNFDFSSKKIDKRINSQEINFYIDQWEIYSSSFNNIFFFLSSFFIIYKLIYNPNTYIALINFTSWLDLTLDPVIASLRVEIEIKRLSLILELLTFLFLSLWAIVLDT